MSKIDWKWNILTVIKFQLSFSSASGQCWLLHLINFMSCVLPSEFCHTFQSTSGGRMWRSSLTGSSLGWGSSLTRSSTSWGWAGSWWPNRRGGRVNMLRCDSTSKSGYIRELGKLHLVSPSSQVSLSTYSIPWPFSIINFQLSHPKTFRSRVINLSVQTSDIRDQELPQRPGSVRFVEPQRGPGALHETLLDGAGLGVSMGLPFLYLGT